MLSNKDVKLYIAANINSDEVDSVIVRNALIRIAQELQRFQHESEISQQNIQNTNEKFVKLNIYSTKMKFRNKKIRKLKGNLKIACTLAKVVLSAKDRETNLLVNHLNIIRDESSNLLRHQAQSIVFIKKLQADNESVYNELQRINSFIRLGYQELQKMRNKIPQDIPHIMELKEILLACGQYYANYCNEHERSALLEQRNRFLKNKLCILENNLAATTEELRNLRNQNIRLTRTLDAKQTDTEGVLKTQINIKTEDYSEKRLNKSRLTLRWVDENSQIIASKAQHIVSHLSGVSSLLHHQDSMLQDLKKLSQELCSYKGTSQSGTSSLQTYYD